MTVTYEKLQTSKTATLEIKAQFLHDNCTDYMHVQDGNVIINYGDGDVWLCEASSHNLDDCKRIRPIPVFVGYDDEGLAIYVGVML